MKYKMILLVYENNFIIYEQISGGQRKWFQWFLYSEIDNFPSRPED